MVCKDTRTPTGASKAAEQNSSAPWRSPTDVIETVTFPTVDLHEPRGSVCRFFPGSRQAARPGYSARFRLLRPASTAQRFGRLRLHDVDAQSGLVWSGPARVVARSFRRADRSRHGWGCGGDGRAATGCGRGLSSLADVTMGTGIGGAVAPGSPAASRLMHAEMGTSLFAGTRAIGTSPACALFTAIVSKGSPKGPAIVARWGSNLDALPAAHEAREIIAGTCAARELDCADAFGGAHRVRRRRGWRTGSIPLVREATARYLNGYLEPLRDRSRLEDYICAPALGARSGVTGALLLAQALHESRGH